MSMSYLLHNKKCLLLLSVCEQKEDTISNPTLVRTGWPFPGQGVLWTPVDYPNLNEGKKFLWTLKGDSFDDVANKSVTFQMRMTNRSSTNVESYYTASF